MTFGQTLKGCYDKSAKISWHSQCEYYTRIKYNKIKCTLKVIYDKVAH